METNTPLQSPAEDMQRQITELFKYSVSDRPKFTPDFFSISEYSHYEDVLSNWYAFFFSTKGEHGFGRLGVQALLDLIQVKAPGSLISGFMEHNVDCRREVKTKKGNYIDIVLYTEEININTFEEAILIENKVHHIVNNNLKDYYDSIKTTSREQKGAVLMTLWPYLKPLPEGYVNITHSQFMRHVLQLLPQYWQGCNEKYLIYLKDIEQNIQRLTSEMQMNTNIRFYVENTRQFHAMQQVAKEAADFVYGQIKQAAAKLELGYSGTVEDYRHIWQEGIKHIYYTVLLHDFFQDGKTIHVVIELWDKKALGLMDAYNAVCEKIESEQHVNRKPVYDGKANYRYYAWATYTFTPDQIENLSEILATGIKEDLEPIRKAITAVYTSA